MKRKVQRQIRVRAYEVVRRAVEEGIEAGLRRAHKYAEHPTTEALAEHLEREILNAVLEVLDFGDS